MEELAGFFSFSYVHNINGIIVTQSYEKADRTLFERFVLISVLHNFSAVLNEILTVSKQIVNNFREYFY